VRQLRFSYYNLLIPIPDDDKRTDELNIPICYRRGRYASD
jgi:hypothetical protein